MGPQYGDYDEYDLKQELDSYNNYDYKKHKKNDYKYNKKDVHREDEQKNNNNWSISGNSKCRCGSGKKYKKCCKKLEKHQDKMYKNKFNNNDNGYDRNRGQNGRDVIDELNEVIDRAEYDIVNFKGKKQDKIRMMKELDKLKRQKNALYKKLESERNKEIKARNRQNRYNEEERNYNKNKKKKGNNNRVYINNGNNNNNNNGGNRMSNNAAVNSVIAI